MLFPELALFSMYIANITLDVKNKSYLRLEIREREGAGAESVSAFSSFLFPKSVFYLLAISTIVHTECFVSKILCFKPTS